MNRVDVIGIECFGYHGCLPEETKIGAQFVVDVVLYTDFKDSAKTDNLDLTIDYVYVNKIVEEEMAIPSKLIETVGYRIKDRLYTQFQGLKKTSITIKKINPPINGNVKYVAICIEE